ncbi:uncharacterized protein [Dermacentor albipictus]|uniref:uncharacterized protein n=1 Tax=Dermacentor albipictus TaxID=60249 RepID=UPI0031FBD351
MPQEDPPGASSVTITAPPAVPSWTISMRQCDLTMFAGLRTEDADDWLDNSDRILDKTFDEYVDLSPEDTIPDLSKILLRPQVDSEQQCASTSTKHIAASSMVASGREDHENGLGISFDLFPTRNFYSRVTSLLLEKYRQLKDVVGSGADSWKVALRYRFKNQLRVLPGDGRVGENRAKFGSRRKGSEETATVELQWHKVQNMDVAISTIAGEDETSFEMHTEWLSCESRKGSPEEDRINERMALTCRQRISDITTNSIHEAKRKYPYMMSFERDQIIPATPCIVFSGADVVEADILHFKVDREKLLAVKNGGEGLAAVLSAYWLFNIQYDRKLFNTLVVLECLFFGLTLRALRVVATKFLNKVTKSEPC